MGAGGAKGAKNTYDEKSLAAQYNLTPAQIQALITAFKAGADAKAEIDKERFVKVVKYVREMNPELAAFEDEVAGLVFTLCDTDHSGKVDPFEVVAALSVFSSGNNQEKAKLVFKTIDKNADGSLAKDEIKKHAQKVGAFSASLVKGDTKSKMKEADMGMLGSIAAAAVSSSLSTLEKKFAEDITREVFTIDKNGDGKITLEEWLAAVETNNTVRALVDPNLSANAWRVVFSMDDGTDSNAIIEQIQASPKGFAYIFDLEMKEGKFKPVGKGVPRPPPKPDFDLVLNYGGKATPIKILVTETLSALKKQAETVTKVPADKVALRKKDFTIRGDDGDVLSSGFDLADGDELSVFDLSSCAGELVVKTLTGKNISISFAAGDKIRVLKERLQDKEGIPPDQQRLIYQGRQLDDDQTTVSYTLVPGVTVHLVLRLRAN